MTKTNLAYIDEVANASASTPTAKTVSMGGFRFKAATETLSNDAKAYAEDRDRLRTMLERAGITPLAMVPSAWWTDVLEKSDLVTTDMSDRGLVGFTGNQARSLRDAANGLIMAAGLGILLVTFLGSTGWAVYEGANLFSETTFAAGTESMSPATIFGLACTVLVALPLLVLMMFRRLLFKAAVSAFISPRSDFMRRFMSFGEQRRSDNGVHCSYTLPTPPADQAAVLSKLDAIIYRNDTSYSKGPDRVLPKNVGIAAEAEAFAMSSSIPDMLLRWTRDEAVRQNEEAARLRAEAWARDPIVYVTEGRAVAIVVQYGDFPIEKEVVDAAVKLEL